MGRGGAFGAEGGALGVSAGGGGGTQYVKLDGSTALLPIRVFT